MRRITIIAITLGLAVVVLLWWIASGTNQTVQDRNRLLTEQGLKEASQRRDEDRVVRPPPDLPRTEAFEAVRIEYPKDDSRRRLGGPVVLSVRGNLVAFRRRTLGAPEFVRLVLSEARRRDIMEQALKLSVPAAPGAALFAVSIAQGKSIVSRAAVEKEIEELLRLADAPAPTWPAPRLHLRLEEATGALAAEPKPWPKGPGLPAPSTFAGEGAEVKGTDEARARLVQLLGSDPLVRDPESGKIFRIGAYAVILP